MIIQFYDFISVHKMKFSKRILKEIKRIQIDPIPGISCTVHPDNFRYFYIIIDGPPDTCYEGGKFHAEMFLEKDFPMKAPLFRFLTKVYHPNIDRLGRVCMSVLKEDWSPAMGIRTLCLSAQILLQAPNPDDPLDGTVAQMWKENKSRAEYIAREMTRKYAM